MRRAWRVDALDADEIGESRHESTAVLRCVDQIIELVLAGDIATEVDAPDVLRMPHKPQLRIGDAHFRGPAGCVTGDLAFPHAVPAVVVPLVVEECAIVQRPGGADAEVETAALVVIRIDEDLEAVGIRALIAPGEPGDDGIGMRVVQPRADVERGVVVGDVDDGALRRDGALGRIALHEARDALRGLPERLPQLAIDRDRL